MKTTAPVHVDRLARVLAANGIQLKRAKVIEIAAAAFGFHNSNEFQAAARSGDLAPPMADLIGTFPLTDGAKLLVLNDPLTRGPFAITQAFHEEMISQGRSGTIMMSPYGGLVTMPGDVDNAASLLSPSPSQSPSGDVVIDVDTLSTLIEGADAHGDMLNDDLKDDQLSDEHREANSVFLDDIETAVRRARSLYDKSRQPTMDDASNPGYAYDSARFSLVHNDVLTSLIEAADSHLQDAESGVEEGIYEASDNGWTKGLRKAIDAARLARPPVREAPAESPPLGLIYTATLITPHSEDMRFSTDPVDLDRMIADHCRREWATLSGTETGDIDPNLLPDAQVVDMFYAEHAKNDESEHSLRRTTAEVMRAVRPSSIGSSRPSMIADALEASIGLDIWDDDAVARHDGETVQNIAETKQAMIEAVRLLRNESGADRTSPIPVPPISRTGEAEPAWTTDIEGDLIYGLTRDDLERLNLDYMRGDGKNDWTPLTEEEMSYLQPGAHISGPGGMHRNTMWTPDINGMEIRIGQSCVWKGQKWQVPSVEFSYGEDEKARAFADLEAYVGNLRPLVSRIGGEIVIRPDATDFSHEVDVFLPMSLALDFPGTEDWARALAWLLCPADIRDRLPLVRASFNTATSSPGYDVSWDATFDVLREGMARAVAYVRGDEDDDLLMRYAESDFAHKDAWALWNEGWELELDIEGLRRLYVIA